MSVSYAKMKHLFLRQSYLDAWDDFERVLNKNSFITWDAVILTASNEDQAQAFRHEIEFRLQNGLLPQRTEYEVLPDPEGKRVGSGGATLNVLNFVYKQYGEKAFEKRILVIHSGGDSKRVPQYSACGKLFSPVPRELPNGRASSLFDEFMAGTAGIPGRMQSGMLVMSGDVLLLFNALQIDLQYHGAAAISIKEHVSTGKDHGVFLNDGHGMVKRFLHKQTEEQLQTWGAVNEQGNVDLDTGAVMMDSELMRALFSLISTKGIPDTEKFRTFVNEKARISFYGDFLYPLAQDSSLKEYYLEAPEGSFCEELHSCRTKIWEAIHQFSMKVICLSPAEFIHFGTTRELLNLVTKQVEDYEYLDWHKQICSNREQENGYAAHNSQISCEAQVGNGCYLEDSYIEEKTVIGEDSVISHLRLKNVHIPSDTVLHGICLKNGKYVVRIYGTKDNPKGTLEDNTGFLTGKIQEILEFYQIPEQQIWKGKEHHLWFADLYPICSSMEEAVQETLNLIEIAEEKSPASTVKHWLSQDRSSLYLSFNEADVSEILPWKRELENQNLTDRFTKSLKYGKTVQKSLDLFGQVGLDQDRFDLLMKKAQESDFSLKIRIYYALSVYAGKANTEFARKLNSEELEQLCFHTISHVIYENSRKYIQSSENCHISENSVKVELPVRVNWGGGWTDTPPYCNEEGGIVLNAAITLDGKRPIQVEVRKLKELHVQFVSEDIGVEGICTSIEEIRDCHNPYDFFALHKAALIACGIVPFDGNKSLQEILAGMGGGIYLSTKVTGIPKGSGLGTSSILSGACVRALHTFLGRSCSDTAIYDIVLCMEQIMSTGGGWQDQVGGLTPGIKMITTDPGIDQHIKVEQVSLPESAWQELQERFALIYTGQRRLARNLLREVVGNYVGGRPESVQAPEKMKVTAQQMKESLEKGDIDELAELFNEHWELSRQLDLGATNTCIDQIFLACEDLIDGKFIAGAGGGGFLQVILKKGITKEQLHSRLHDVFQDNGVDVWKSEFVRLEEN